MVPYNAIGGITGWTTMTPINLWLLNGKALNFPTPTIITTEQYIRINNQANIQQLINNLPYGVYELYLLNMPLIIINQQIQ